MCTLAVNALLFFDQTSVTVALPAMHREFGAPTVALQWTITAYLLALAVFMVVAGRLADRFGRRRMLLAGIGLFGLASAACAAAPSFGFLIATRFVQGIGGAIMQPLALGNTSRAIGEQRRGWAVGLLSTGGTTFLTVGPVLSGVIVDVASWRWLFVINLPVVVFALYQGRRWITPSREAQPTRIEGAGLLLLITGLASVVIGVSQLSVWRSVAPVLILVGALLLGLLVRHELRSNHPLVPVALLGRNRYLLAALTALFAIQFAVLGTSVYLVIFLQHGMGERALTAGLVLALSGMFTPLLSLSTGRFTDRHGPRGLVLGGLALATAGLIWVGLAAPHRELWLLIPGLLAFSLSRPAVFTPASAGAFTTISPNRSGLASGLVTEARQLGSVFGVAVLGAVIAGTHGDLPGAEGFSAAMLVAAAVTAIAGIITAFVLPRKHQSTPR
ncbi:MFS transporter [Saccharopolyspora sp. K220]|uniref:MFS transporter n=1 Tax=Saccharopolyspora soli TaxID=2926618 RepID=UPI001F59F0C7|nr:MFS transporter [Saccharopolyspora soli]MCI2418530.1 MFS transporter [Saccharopolyspora soli]